MTVGNAWEIVHVYTSLKKAKNEKERLESDCGGGTTFKIMQRWDGFYTLFERVRR
jgi:hypothetical protein